MKHYDFIKKALVSGYSISPDGVLFKFGKEVPCQIQTTGYRCTRLWVRGDDRRPNITIHQISWVHFHGTNVKNINHIDGNKLNNRPENLEKSGHSHNLKHAYRTGLRTPNHGARSGMTTLTDAIVLEIRDHVSKGKSQSEVARMYGMTKSTISYIITRRTWKHI